VLEKNIQVELYRILTMMSSLLASAFDLQIFSQASSFFELKNCMFTVSLVED